MGEEESTAFSMPKSTPFSTDFGAFTNPSKFTSLKNSKFTQTCEDAKTSNDTPFSADFGLHKPFQVKPIRKRTEVIYQKGPGDMFGEVAILHNMPRTASVRAKNKVTLWVLTQAEFYTITTREKMIQNEVLEKVLINHSIFEEQRNILMVDYYKNKNLENSDKLVSNACGEVETENFVQNGLCPGQIDLHEDNLPVIGVNDDEKIHNQNVDSGQKGSMHQKDDLNTDDKILCDSKLQSDTKKELKDDEKKYLKLCIQNLIASDKINYCFLSAGDIVRKGFFFVVVCEGTVLKTSHNKTFSIKPGMVLNAEYICKSELEGFYVPKIWK
ncbi:hypothetical protein EDEG_01167 [Edhazardia aedis USNM 41457]|uniref:Cyclic nucleotide-binding domain-containing protein n=1 Tax=Edhazardia aedis (strain USNM 41457) TaxID=1003232 RepID=J9DQ15_EDHAE|nr:hypothetical protein EDEG_01167 [Edhazardia aedis USNM 41457]|eukprot:EJW04640.1 hypothetical protein EDEG_01167 [Edhazardia aedis USNM 41457]